MKQNTKIRNGIDFLMTFLLLCLMAFQITGQRLHEWLGTGMLVLFIIHNILNFRWYRNLFKGEHGLMRSVQIIVNSAVLASILCTGYSGIVMSRHVFAELPAYGSMTLARSMHLAASYWGFVLMSVHLGMHWGKICGMYKRLLHERKISDGHVRVLRAAGAIIALYGLICFIGNDIASYMFLKNQFVFFDYDQSVLAVFGEHIAMMGFWIAAGYYITKVKKGRKKHE
ncbi:MAG: DUF4405 domain-containing protein [Candidatus Fimisoma sp.]